MWTDFISAERFVSCERSGKWMFDVPVGEADAVYERIRQAVQARDVPAAKRASPRLEALLGPGFTILLAYVSDKGPAAVEQALSRLRAHGVTAPARFKCDEATYLGRERVAYLSEDFEGNGTADPAWPRAGDLVRLDDGTCIDLLLVREDREGLPWGVGHEMDLRTLRTAGPDPDMLADPRERRLRRMNLARIDLGKVVEVLDRPEWKPPHAEASPDPAR